MKTQALLDQLHTDVAKEQESGSREFAMFLLNPTTDNLRRAAELGHVMAKSFLGSRLVSGLDPAWAKEGFELLLETARAGCVASYGELSMCYAVGVGTDPDQTEAQYWCTRCTEVIARKYTEEAARHSF